MQRHQVFFGAFFSELVVDLARGSLGVANRLKRDLIANLLEGQVKVLPGLLHKLQGRGGVVRHPAVFTTDLVPGANLNLSSRNAELVIDPISR